MAPFRGEAEALCSIRVLRLMTRGGKQTANFFECMALARIRLLPVRGIEFDQELVYIGDPFL
jgi:hypothetical protein